MILLHIMGMFFQSFGIFTGMLEILASFWPSVLQDCHIWLAKGGYLYTHLVQHVAVIFT
jgi:hypothetical protein